LKDTAAIATLAAAVGACGAGTNANTSPLLPSEVSMRCAQVPESAEAGKRRQCEIDALASLAKEGKATEQVVTALSKAVNDPDPGMHTTAIDGLVAVVSSQNTPESARKMALDALEGTVAKMDDDAAALKILYTLQEGMKTPPLWIPEMQVARLRTALDADPKNQELLAHCAQETGRILQLPKLSPACIAGIVYIAEHHPKAFNMAPDEPKGLTDHLRGMEKPDLSLAKRAVGLECKDNDRCQKFIGEELHSLKSLLQRGEFARLLNGKNEIGALVTLFERTDTEPGVKGGILKDLFNLARKGNATVVYNLASTAGRKEIDATHRTDIINVLEELMGPENRLREEAVKHLARLAGMLDGAERSGIMDRMIAQFGKMSDYQIDGDRLYAATMFGYLSEHNFSGMTPKQQEAVAVGLGKAFVGDPSKEVHDMAEGSLRKILREGTVSPATRRRIGLYLKTPQLAPKKAAPPQQQDQIAAIQ